MKVLYLCPNGFLGGAEAFVIKTSRQHLANRKVIPSIIFFSDGQAYRLAQEWGIQTFLLKTKFRLLNPFSLIRASLEIFSIHQKIKPEIVHLTMPYSILAAFSLFFLTRSKKVWFQHGPVGGKLDFLASFFPVHGLVFNSHYTQSQHLKQTPLFFKTRKAIIYPGVEIPEKSLRSSAPLEIINLGRISIGKSQIDFLKAIKAISCQLDHAILDQCKFKLIGSATSEKDKKYESILKKFIADNHLDSRVTLIPHQKDLTQVYDSAHILVHCPASPEAFGLVIAEAMVHEVLVLAKRIGGITEVVSSEDFGKTYQDTDELEECLLALIHMHFSAADTDSLIKTKNKAREHVIKNFSLQTSTDNLEKFYQEIS